jgi:hypothetical protein
MNNQFIAISLTGAVASALGMVSFAAPAHACHSTEGRIGVADFSGCQKLSVIGGSPSRSVMAAYRQRQAAQLTVAIADYHQAFTANIAQWQVQRTLMTHELKMGELALSNIALVQSGNTITTAEASRVARVTRGK